MKTFHLFCVVAFGTIAFVSCGDKEKEKQWIAERDSISSVNTQLQFMLDNMTGTVADISMSLDSIARLENMIVLGFDEEGNKLSKKSMKGKLQALSDLIVHQRERMSAMDSALVADNATISQLKKIIAFLDASLQQKDKEINKLKKELDRKDFNISELTSHISTLQDTVSVVQQKNEEQQQVIDQQTAMMNEVYYIIATKDVLSDYGIIEKSGKIIKKTKINFSSINKSFLVKADKRELKTIHINGKSPKILCEVPKESYTLNTGKNSSTLTIHDANKFWSANNKLLIIQIKD